jgi:hypothetical protein
VVCINLDSELLEVKDGLLRTDWMVGRTSFELNSAWSIVSSRWLAVDEEEDMFFE